MNTNPCKKCGCIPNRKVFCTSRLDKKTGRRIYPKNGRFFCFLVCGCCPV